MVSSYLRGGTAVLQGELVIAEAALLRGSTPLRSVDLLAPGWGMEWGDGQRGWRTACGPPALRGALRAAWRYVSLDSRSSD